MTEEIQAYMPDLNRSEVKIARRQVVLIGTTAAKLEGLARLEPTWCETLDTRASGAEILMEFAGRGCYDSFGRPNPETRSIIDYLTSIKMKRHLSVLEHSFASIAFRGVSRTFTHELVRHRHLSYSQLSQRFARSGSAAIVLHPALVDLKRTNPDLYDQLINNELPLLAARNTEIYDLLAESLTGGGLARKQALEAARCVLPNMTETKVVVSGNMRAWRHFMLLRGTEQADREICEIAVEVYRLLSKEHPNLFDDINIITMLDGRLVLVSDIEDEYH